ncbi:MAG: PQQ-binding-like beta-propeller repeat protein, partial [Aeoliella sp.]
LIHGEHSAMMNQRHLAALAGILLLNLVMATTSSAADASWPQFRGPDGQGNVPQSEAPLEWTEDQGVRWKTAIPGRGWSSPVVLGDQIWLTTAVETEVDPEVLKRRTEGNPMANSLEMAGSLSLRVVCVDRSSGTITRNEEVFHISDPNPIHSLNSYASPSPIIEPGRLYCNFGRYGTACVDTSSGSKLWERQFTIEHYVGPGSSPVTCGDVLVLTCDGADQQFITAVNKMTGEDAWKVDRPPIRAKNPDFRKSYCTPLVVEYNGQKQIVIPGAQWFIAYDPKDGGEIWRVDHGNGFSLVPRPVVEGDHVYCCTGFNGVGLVSVRLGGAGDVTKTHVEWQHRQQAPTQPSPIIHMGRIYTISDNGIGQCLDAGSGEEKWKKRLPGNYSASPLRIGERLYFFNRDGLTTVISADGEVLAENQLEGEQMATPAVVEGELILRTDTHLYAIGNK